MSSSSSSASSSSSSSAEVLAARWQEAEAAAAAAAAARRAEALRLGLDEDDVDAHGHGGGGDPHEDMTEDEKDAVAVRCLRIFNLVLLLCGAALVGAALYGATVGGGAGGGAGGAGLGAALFYALAGVGGGVVVVTLVGLVGAAARAVPLLLAYHVCLVFLAFGLLVLGGFCFLLSDAAVALVQANWVSIQQQLPAAQRATQSADAYSQTLRIALAGLGLGAFALLTLLLCALTNVTRLVTPLKGYSLALEATNTTLVPVGVALIAVATWVAQTAVGAEALVPAFAVFALGVFVVVLVLVGFAGTTLRSRGVMRLFMVTTLLLAAAFLALGVAALVAGPRLTAVVAAQWPTLRRVLPAGFAGKYDPAAFAVYVRGNLAALGFVALCTGALLAAQSFAALRLRFELKAVGELEDQVVEAGRTGALHPDEVEQLLALRAAGPLERLWKAAWKHGSLTSRASVVLGCLALLFAACVVVGVALAALYYSTSCASLSRFSQAYDYGGADLGPVVVLSSSFARGSVSLRVAPPPAGAAAIAAAAAALAAGAPYAGNVTAAFTKSSYSAGMSAPGYPPVRPWLAPWAGGLVDALYQGSPSAPVAARAIGAAPAGPTAYLGYDVSCQAAELSATLPSAAAANGGNTFEASLASGFVVSLSASGPANGVAVDWSATPAALRPRLLRLDLATGDGDLTVAGALVGAKGLAATSAGGAIDVSGLDAQCDPADLGSTSSGGVRLATATGSIALAASAASGCDVLVQADAAPAAVSDFVALGGGSLSVVGAAGEVSLVRARADSISVTGDAGAVTIINCTAGRTLRASAGAGAVQVLQLRLAAGATLQVDTDGGDVTVSADQFAGYVSVLTSGTVSCAGAGFDSGAAAACGARAARAEPSADGGAQLTALDSVAVNCAARGDCAYLGGLVVTSARGNVRLTMAAWSR
jgi:hypothetical protein